MTPRAEQPKAIDDLVRIFSEGYASGTRTCASLEGETGTGKTLVMAKVIHELEKPVLWLCHTKELVQQTERSLREYLPQANVELLVSPFSDYRPSSVVYEDKSPGAGRRKKYIGGRGVVDEELSARRDSALRSIKKGRLTIIVASIAAVFGCKHPDWPRDLRDEAGVYRTLLDGLGDELTAAKQEIEKLEAKISEGVRRGTRLQRLEACKTRRDMLTKDLDRLEKTGWCSELPAKYSAFLPEKFRCTPIGLMNQQYGKDWLLVVDESHATMSSIRTPAKASRTRTQRLVDSGFRLESSLQGGPLSAEEFFERRPLAVLAASATPNKALFDEFGLKPKVVRMVQRPTHILDPEVRAIRCGRSYQDQRTFFKDLFDDIYNARKAGMQSIIVCFTRTQAEELAACINGGVLPAAYVHSTMDAKSKTATLQAFRQGKIDVLVGANLLREGLDFPRAGLIYVLDADRNGFMRDATSLIQFVGRVARHPNGKAILAYNTQVTERMKRCMERAQTNSAKQSRYNLEHRFSPEPLKSDPLPRMERVHPVDCGSHEGVPHGGVEGVLKLVPQIGDVRAKGILDHYGGDAEAIVKATARGGSIREVRGVGPAVRRMLKEYSEILSKGLDRAKYRSMLEEAVQDWLQSICERKAREKEREEAEEEEEEEQWEEQRNEEEEADEREEEVELAAVGARQPVLP